MRRSSLRRAGALALGLLISVSLLYGISRLIALAERNNCRSNLSALGYAIFSYSHKEACYPSTPNDLIPRYMVSRVFLMCPAVDDHKKDVPNGTDWGDFTYINWPNNFDVPEREYREYPQLYDCAFSNHGGRGINILRIGGDVLWDPGATWLKNFAASHPE